MDLEELRARIGAAPPSAEAELLQKLRNLSQVQSAHSTWFHGWVEIRVFLNDWSRDAQAEPFRLIDEFAREHVDQFRVTSDFVPPVLSP